VSRGNGPCGEGGEAGLRGVREDRAQEREGGGTATRGRYGGADRWGELGRRREVGSMTRRWRGGVRERAVRAPLGLGGLLAEAWRENGPRCWASGRAGALGCCTSLAGPLGWGKEVAGRDWAWAWSLPGLTVWAGRRVCGLGCSRVWAGLAIGLFPSSFLLQTSLKLFEFKLKFESNPTTLKQVKLMHQHECTNKLALKMNYKCKAKQIKS